MRFSRRNGGERPREGAELISGESKPLVGRSWSSVVRAAWCPLLSMC